jgi:enoyl-CoA hydratase/carnithine racemase
METELIFEKREKTAYIRINRSGKYNSMNLAVRKGLYEAWQEVEHDPDICSVILTGGEEVFSTGVDMVELSQFREKEPMAEMPYNNMETFGANVTKPVIAAISGYCLGAGLLMVMVASDLRIASTSARFGMPEVKIGITPAFGIPPLLSSHFPHSAAMEMLMLGNNLTAEDAYRLGFVSKMVEPNLLMETAEEYAERINNFSPLVIKNVKEVFKAVTAPDPKAIFLSNAVSLLGRHSEDYIEGPRAFREKRKPVWKGK